MNVLLRPLEPGDIEPLRRIHEAQQRAIGAEYQFPPLGSDPRYRQVVVGEEDGKVVGALVTHQTTEIYVIARSPKLLRAILKKRPNIEAMLARQGVDELHAFVPHTMISRMRWFLKQFGFRRSDDRFVTFYREVETDE